MNHENGVEKIPERVSLRAVEHRTCTISFMVDEYVRRLQENAITNYTILKFGFQI